MANYYNRSKSYSYSTDHHKNNYYNNNMQMENYNYNSNNYGPYGPSSISSTYANNNHIQDFRSYSISSYNYSSSYDHSAAAQPPPPPLALALALPPQPPPLKKGKSTSGSTSKSWSFNDPEFQRKKRVASYKVYSAEGKVKGSFRKSFRWIKDKYSQVVYGWW